MTENELKAEALKQGFRLAKIPEYDCSCYMPYPNEGHRHKNGKWKCIDYMENIDNASESNYMHCTHCKRKYGYGPFGKKLTETELTEGVAFYNVQYQEEAHIED